MESKFAKHDRVKGFECQAKSGILTIRRNPSKRIVGESISSHKTKTRLFDVQESFA